MKAHSSFFAFLLLLSSNTAWAALSCDDIMDMINNKMPEATIINMMKRSSVTPDAPQCLDKRRASPLIVSTAEELLGGQKSSEGQEEETPSEEQTTKTDPNKPSLSDKLKSKLASESDASGNAPFDGYRLRLGLGTARYNYTFTADSGGVELPKNVDYATPGFHFGLNAEAWFLNDTVGAEMGFTTMPYEVEIGIDSVEESFKSFEVGGRYRYTLNSKLAVEGGLAIQTGSGIAYGYANNFAAATTEEVGLGGMSLTAAAVTRIKNTSIRAEIWETFSPTPVSTGLKFMSDVELLPLGIMDSRLLANASTTLNWRHFSYEGDTEEAKIREFNWGLLLGAGVQF